MPLPPSTRAIGYQLGNIFLLLLFLGTAVMYSTSEPKVIRSYIVALAIADLTHIYCVYAIMGWDTFTDMKQWNDLTWGNVGATAFLFISRIAYLAGVMGKTKTPAIALKVD